MKKLLRLLSAAVLAAVLLVSCTGGRVIPRGKFAKIYAEMLLRDQWISSHYSTQRIADTSFVYHSILKKYGYDDADYRKSVEYYIKDSERYARILKKSADILDKRHKTLLKLKEKLDSLDHEKFAFNMSARGLRQLSNPKNKNNILVNEAVFFVDSIPSWDWTIDPSRGWDTLWRGPMLDIDTTMLCSTSAK